MSFPYTTIENFESGTLGHFDAESDAGARLDYPHYTELARFPPTHTAMPWQGAYCLRVDLGKATNDAYVQETDSWDMTAGTNNINLRVRFWVSPDLVMANTDEFAIVQFWSSTNTVEAGVYLNYTTANGYRLGLGDTSGSSFLSLTLGEWHTLEVFYDPAGGAGGTLDGWLDKGAFTQVTGLTDADLTSGVVGVLGQDAGTTKGILLINDVTAHLGTDGAKATNRIGGVFDRFPEQLLLDKSGHAFVGHGILDNVSLLSGGDTDNVLTIYDTDHGDTTYGPEKLILKNLAANETPVDPAGVPINLTRGCYVQLAGTNPRALLSVRRAVGYTSEGSIRAYAAHGQT